MHLPTLARNIPILDLLDRERVEIVHDAAMRIVEQIGLEFRHDESLRCWRDAGADVREQRVRIPRELLMSLVATVPEEWDYHARNPARTVRVGGRHMVFGPAYATPTVIDLEGVRRAATLADLKTLIKLNHAVPVFHYNGGYNVEPMDVPIAHRHLHMVYTAVRYSDKPFMGGVISRAAAEDSIAMARIVFGAEFVDNHVVLAGILNCNSPLVWDATSSRSRPCSVRAVSSRARRRRRSARDRKGAPRAGRRAPRRAGPPTPTARRASRCCGSMRDATTPGPPRRGS